MGKNNQACNNTMFLPHGPHAVRELREELRRSMSNGVNKNGVNSISGGSGERDLLLFKQN
jgi:hypothetical protein